MRCTILAAGLACAMTTACMPAMAPEASEGRDWEPRRTRCLRIDRVDNWRVIDSRQLIVYGPRRDEPWHMRLIVGCTQLRSAEAIVLRARGTQEICGDPGDELIVRGERCAIRSLRPISPAEAAALLDPDTHDDIGRLPPREEK